jgi:transcription elongation factor Elf1
MKCDKCGSEVYKNSVCHNCVALIRDKYPCYTEQKIGDMFGGISRERVRQILAKKGRRTSSTKRDMALKRLVCPRCGKEKKKHAQTCKQCYHELHNVILTCTWCGGLYEVNQSQIIHKINVHNQTVFFCCKKCQGSWCAKHYGFQRKYSPEEYKLRQKQRNKEYRELHKTERAERTKFWLKHGNKERIEVLYSLITCAEDEIGYKGLFEITSKTFPELFLSVDSLRMFLSHHKDLFEVKKHGKVILKGK